MIRTPYKRNCFLNLRAKMRSSRSILESFFINYDRVSKERKEDTKIYYRRFLASSKVIILKGILDKPTAF